MALSANESVRLERLGILGLFHICHHMGRFRLGDYTISELPAWFTWFREDLDNTINAHNRRIVAASIVRVPLQKVALDRH